MVINITGQNLSFITNVNVFHIYFDGGELVWSSSAEPLAVRFGDSSFVLSTRKDNLAKLARDFQRWIDNQTRIMSEQKYVSLGQYFNCGEA